MESACDKRNLIYVRCAFSNDFEIFKGNTGTTEIRYPFITQSCLIFKALNLAVYVLKKNICLELATADSSSVQSSVPAPPIKRATLVLNQFQALDFSRRFDVEEFSSSSPTPPLYTPATQAIKRTTRTTCF